LESLDFPPLDLVFIMWFLVNSIRWRSNSVYISH